MKSSAASVAFRSGIAVLLFAILFVAGWKVREATSGPGPAEFPVRVAHAPTPMPDRVVLTWAGDPAATQAVTWRTDVSVGRAVAELTPATDAPLEEDDAKEFPAATVLFASDLGDAHYHSVEFADLTPDTLYAYRVGDGVNWTEWYQFRTASREAKPFSFIYFGDAQNDVRAHWSRVVREAVFEASRPAFTLHAGDLIGDRNLDHEWGEWHGAPAWVNASVPVVPTPGNHEYYQLADEETPYLNQHLWNTRDGRTLELVVAIDERRDSAGKPDGYLLTARPVVGFEKTARASGGLAATAVLDSEKRFVSVDAVFTRLTGFASGELAGRKPEDLPLGDRPGAPDTELVSRHWRPQFTLPLNGPPGHEEVCYTFDYQGVRVVALDSKGDLGVQAAWLRKVLARDPQRWTILTFHYPIFSPGKELARDKPELRAAWKPVIDEFKVDLVLSGHDHTYARSGDVTGRIPAVTAVNLPSGYNQVYDPSIGTVYVVSVSGPKMYNLDEGADYWAVRFAEETQLFQIITVDGDELSFEARTATNRLYDAFTLKKRDGLPNELIETLQPDDSGRGRLSGSP